MPVFDVYCQSCDMLSEVVGEVDKLSCPLCGGNVERKWSFGKPLIIIKGRVEGETPGTRDYARELSRKGGKLLREQMYSEKNATAKRAG